MRDFDADQYNRGSLLKFKFFYLKNFFKPSFYIYLPITNVITTVMSGYFQYLLIKIKIAFLRIFFGSFTNSVMEGAPYAVSSPGEIIIQKSVFIF